MKYFLKFMVVISTLMLASVCWASETEATKPTCPNPLYSIDKNPKKASESILHGKHYCLHPDQSGKAAKVINPIRKFEAWLIAQKYAKAYRLLSETTDKSLFIHHFIALYGQYHYAEKRHNHDNNSLHIATLITDTVNPTGYMPLDLLPDNDPKVFVQLQQTAQQKTYPTISKQINDLVFEVLFVDGKKPDKKPKPVVKQQKKPVQKPRKPWDGLTKAQRQDKSDCKLKRYLLRGPNVSGNIEDVFFATDFCMREQVRPLNTLVVKPILTRKQAFEVAIKYRQSYEQLTSLEDRAMLAYYFLKTLSHDSFVEPTTAPQYLSGRNKLLLPITIPVKSDRSNTLSFIEMDVIPFDTQKKVLSQLAWRAENVLVGDKDIEPYIKAQVHQVIFGEALSTESWIALLNPEPAEDLAIKTPLCWKVDETQKQLYSKTTLPDLTLFAKPYCIDGTVYAASHNTGLWGFEYTAIRNRFDAAASNFTEPADKALFIHHFLKRLSHQYRITVGRFFTTIPSDRNTQDAVPINIGYYDWEEPGRNYRRTRTLLLNSTYDKTVLKRWQAYAEGKTEAAPPSTQMKGWINHIVLEPIDIPNQVQARLDEYEREYEQALLRGP